MSRASFEDVEYSVERGTAHIMMNRPQVLNALSQGMFRDLTRALRLAMRDEDVSFIAITGAGKAFSAGLDIVQVSRLKKKLDAKSFVYGLVKPFWDTFLACEKPIISLVNGPAYGAGAEIALFADLVIASENAQFAFSGGRVGALCCISGIMGPLTMNGRIVTEMNLTGQPLSAREAKKLGMVNLVDLEEKLGSTFETLREEMLRVSPNSNASYKRIRRSVIPKQAFEKAYHELFKTLTTANFKKGVEAFVARKPAMYYPTLGPTAIDER